MSFKNTRRRTKHLCPRYHDEDSKFLGIQCVTTIWQSRGEAGPYYAMILCSINITGCLPSTRLWQHPLPFGKIFYFSERTCRCDESSIKQSGSTVETKVNSESKCQKSKKSAQIPPHYQLLRTHERYVGCEVVTSANRQRKSNIRLRQICNQCLCFQFQSYWVRIQLWNTRKRGFFTLYVWLSERWVSFEIHDAVLYGFFVMFR